MLRSNGQMRGIAAALLAMSLVGCGTATPPTGSSSPTDGQQSPPTTGAPQPTSSGQPIATGEPLPDEPFPLEPGEVEITDDMLNPPRESLPEPELEDVDQIAQAMFDGGDEEQVIVSMLKVLNIGVYRVDGTPIRTGTEQSDEDLYLFEPEVHGLVEMLRAQSDGESWISFREFHADLLEFGLEATPEELLQVYLDTYAQYPDSPMTRFVQAEAFLDVDAQFPPLGAWLLFVDGMIAPHGTQGSIAFAGAGAIGAPPGSPNIGQAFNRLQQLINSPNYQRQQNSARARAALAGGAVTLVASDKSVHEGHGGPGGTVTFTATVNAFYNSSAFGGPAISPCAGGSLQGIGVSWFHSGFDDHGTTSVGVGVGTTTTDSGGRSTMTFQAKPEEPDHVWERGVEAQDIGRVKVIIQGADVAGALCPGVPVGQGTVASSGDPLGVRIRYHVPKAILVTLTQPFNIAFPDGSQLGGQASVKGEDFFVGRMEEKPDGTWHGFFVGRAAGAGTGVFWATEPGCRQK